ncbi:MAG: FGGY-family carbohydrate kinase [Caldilineaceae bacterium]
MTYLLGIDIGTYESKGVLTDAQGRILARAATPHQLAIPQPGWAEHDADAVWWHDFVSLSRELLRQSGVAATEIASIGCSAIGPCVLPVDKTGKPLRPAILYGIDTRAADEVNELTAALGEEWIIREIGSALSAQAAGPKILWLQRHEPALWVRTAHVMTSTSYLVYKLTGRVVIDHYTATAYGPLYNLHQNGWEPRSLALICESNRLPELDWTTAVAGRVTTEAAQQTGLAVGTPVIVGTADAASEAVSAGVVAPGDTMLMYGSTLFFIEVCAKLPHGGVLWPAVSLQPNSYVLAAGMSTTGALTRWFRDELGGVERMMEENGGANAYAALAEAASPIAPGADGLLMLPYFSGERTPINDPLARGVIAGLTLAHSRAHVYRALLEGIAYGIRHNLEALAAAGEPPQRLVAIGGGVQNQLWLQIVSDVTGQAQVVRTTPGAAYGDAFLAGVGVGLFSGIDTIQNWLGPTDQIVQPNPALKTLYDRYYQLYQTLYISTRSVTHALAQLGAGRKEEAA